MREVRTFAEYALQGVGDLGNDLGLLLPGNPVSGDSYAYEGHLEFPLLMVVVISLAPGETPWEWLSGVNCICAWRVDKCRLGYFS
ncbi:hypothetical protein D3C72_2421820 [compost metagenome]